MLRVKKILKSKKGVTLAECIVSIAILAIISTMAYQAFSTSFNNINKKQNIESEIGTAAEELQVLSTSSTNIEKGANASIDISANYKYTKTTSTTNAYVLIDGSFVAYSASNPAHTGLQKYARTAVTTPAKTIGGHYWTYVDDNGIEYTVFVADED